MYACTYLDEKNMEVFKFKIYVNDIKTVFFISFVKFYCDNKK